MKNTQTWKIIVLFIQVEEWVRTSTCCQCAATIEISGGWLEGIGTSILVDDVGQCGV